jgi:broad specificity phosphatase PhoE
MGARARYVHTVQALADKYPTENLLLVTHGMLMLHSWSHSLEFQSLIISRISLVV